MAIITISTHPMIEIIDTLTSAQIKLDAMFMAASALDDKQQDAMQMLAKDADETIELAKDEVQRLIDLGASAAAEGNGNV